MSVQGAEETDLPLEPSVSPATESFAEPSERLKLRYRIRPEDQRALYWFENGHLYRDRAKRHYAEMSFWWGLLVLGIYAGYLAESLFISCVFVVALGVSLRRSISYAKVYWSEVESWFDPYPNHELTVECERDGLGFGWNGRASYAPWSAVEGYALEGDRLYLRLGEEGWTSIPGETLEGGAVGLAKLCAFLDAMGIAQDPGSLETAKAASRDE